MSGHPLTPSDAPCPHCGRPMNRPSMERLSNPYCTGCLEERRQAVSAQRVSPYCTPERIAAGIEATSRAHAHASVYGEKEAPPAPVNGVLVDREVVEALEAAISKDFEHGVTEIDGRAYPLILRALRAALALPAQAAADAAGVLKDVLMQADRVVEAAEHLGVTLTPVDDLGYSIRGLRSAVDDYRRALADALEVQG